MPARCVRGVKQNRKGMTPSTMNQLGADADPFDGSFTYNLVVRKTGGTTELYDVDADSVISSGTANTVFQALDGAIAPNDNVQIQADTYVINDQVVFDDSGVTFDARGATIVLDDQGVQVNPFFMSPNCNGWRIIGGTYDYDRDNNVEGGSPGVQAFIQLRADDVEIHGATFLNAYNVHIIADGGSHAGADIHHCDFDVSGERGVYFSWENDAGVDVWNCRFTNIRAGCIRINFNSAASFGDVRIRNCYMHSDKVNSQVASLESAIGEAKNFLIDHIDTGTNYIRGCVCDVDYLNGTPVYTTYLRFKDGAWDVQGNRFRSINGAADFICHNQKTRGTINDEYNTLLNVNDVITDAC